MARDVRVSLLPECGVANQVEESAAGVVLRRQREIIIKLSWSQHVLNGFEFGVLSETEANQVWGTQTDPQHIMEESI